MPQEMDGKTEDGALEVVEAYMNRMNALDDTTVRRN